MSGHDPLVSISWSNRNTIRENCPLSSFPDYIRGPALVSWTNAVRKAFNEGGKEAAKPHKEKLLAALFAGVFTVRNSDSLTTPAGLLVADLDDIDAERMPALRAAITTDIAVALLFTSPTGTGMKVVVRTGVADCSEESHLRAFLAVERWMRERFGVAIDPSGKDRARLCYLCHDPEAYYNPEARALDLDAWAPVPVPVPTAPPVPSRADSGGDLVERARRYLATLPASIAGDHGHDALFRAAVVVGHGFDLPDGDAMALLEEFNATAVPPWNPADIARKLEQARTVPHRQDRGYLRDQPAGHVAGGATTVVPGSPWAGAPVPIGRESDPPGFDIVDMLPADVPDLSDLVDGVAEALQVPPDLVAGAAIGLAAVACARAVEVQCRDDWREPAPLWMLPLLRPGERKSATLGMLVAPFHAWAVKERGYLAEPIARAAEERETLKARQADLRKRAGKAAPDKRRALEDEASDLAATLAALPACLTAPNLLVQSFTPEGLRDALEANGERVGIVSAETDAAELLGARYSDAGPSIDLLLCAHAGDPITTRRAGGRCVPLERPAVGMVLVVQPEAVAKVLADRAARGRGLIDRMLLFLPPSRMGGRTLDPQPIPRRVSDWWASAIGAVLTLPWPGRVTVNDSKPVRCATPPRILSLEPDAREMLWALRASLEPRLAEGADLAGVSGFVSKLPGACARIALSFTIIRDPQAETVGAEAMRAACAWAPYLLAHHRAVLGEAAEDPAARHARRLWQTLKRRGRATMTKRDMFKMVLDSALPNMEAFAPVLALLAEHGAVRPASAGGGSARGGRPAELYEVHPDLLPPGVMSDETDTTGGANDAA